MIHEAIVLPSVISPPYLLNKSIFYYLQNFKILQDFLTYNAFVTTLRTLQKVLIKSMHSLRNNSIFIFGPVIKRLQPNEILKYLDL